jgi:NADH-quinone oxidoreductase subunit M
VDSSAVPGTAAFVAEDMLVHGALETHPGLTLAMILAMILNAISFLRAFTLTFLGQLRRGVRRGTLQDLLPRERMTAVGLLLVLVLAGIFPGAIVAAQQPAAKAIAYLEQLADP